MYDTRNSDSTMVDLLRAIREHSGLELASIRDAGSYGADAGWSGFSYTSDCVEFFEANAEAIWDMLAEDAEGFGYNVAGFVAGFQRADMLDSYDGFRNLLAWYALEKVGQWLNDRREARGL